MQKGHIAAINTKTLQRRLIATARFHAPRPPARCTSGCLLSLDLGEALVRAFNHNDRWAFQASFRHRNWTLDLLRMDSAPRQVTRTATRITPSPAIALISSSRFQLTVSTGERAKPKFARASGGAQATLAQPRTADGVE